MTPRLLRIVLALVVVLAGVEFAVRGPIRFLQRGQERSTDLAGPYLGARALVRGLNPYSSQVFWDMAAQVGWGEGRTDREDDFESRSPYPVTTFVLLAPLALVDWPAARVAAVAITSALGVGAIAALATLPAFAGDKSRARRWTFVALALGLAPLHSALGTGNVVAAAVALAVIGAWALLRGSPVVAGLCLAVAVCIKPPIAAPVLGYALLRGHWRALGTTAAATALLLAVAAVRLAGTPWVSGYIANNSLLLSNSGVDIIKWSSVQQQFINLQYLGFYLVDNPRTVAIGSLLVGGGLCAVWFLLVLRRRVESPSLLEVSTAVVISLLPIYHRVYDGALLLLPLAWATSSRQPATRRHRAITLMLVLPFLVPGATWLEVQAEAGRLPSAILQQWWWTALVRPHQVWALLAMSVVLLSAQAIEERAS